MCLVRLRLTMPPCLPMTAAFLASSSAVAKPFTIFCRATGGGVGGSDAGGVGGLLRLLCCSGEKEREEKKNIQIRKKNISGNWKWRDQRWAWHWFSILKFDFCPRHLVDQLWVVVGDAVQRGAAERARQTVLAVQLPATAVGWKEGKVHANQGLHEGEHGQLLQEQKRGERAKEREGEREGTWGRMKKKQMCITDQNHTATTAVYQHLMRMDGLCMVTDACQSRIGRIQIWGKLSVKAWWSVFIPLSATASGTMPTFVCPRQCNQCKWREGLWSLPVAAGRCGRRCSSQRALPEQSPWRAAPITCSHSGPACFFFLYDDTKQFGKVFFTLSSLSISKNAESCMPSKHNSLHFFSAVFTYRIFWAFRNFLSGTFYTYKHTNPRTRSYTHTHTNNAALIPNINLLASIHQWKKNVHGISVAVGRVEDWWSSGGLDFFTQPCQSRASPPRPLPLRPSPAFQGMFITLAAIVSSPFRLLLVAVASSIRA